MKSKSQERREAIQRAVANQDTPKEQLRNALALAAEAFWPYGSALTAIRLVPTPQVKTMAIDPYYRVYANLATVARWVELAKAVSPEKPCENCGATHHHDLAYVAGVFIHEVEHPLRLHHLRFAALEGGDPEVWNQAADAEIHNKMGILYMFKHVHMSQPMIPQLCLPPGIETPQKYQFDDALAAEDYYRLLSAPPPQAPEEEQDDEDETQEQEDKQEEESGDADEENDEGEGEESDDADGSDGEGEPDAGDSSGSGDGEPEDGEDGEDGSSGGGASSGPGQAGESAGAGQGAPDASEGEGGGLGEEGSGVDGIPREWEEGPPTQEKPGLEAGEAETVRQDVAQRVAAARQQGYLPGSFGTWAEQALRQPKKDWRVILRRFVKDLIQQIQGDNETTWAKLSEQSWIGVGPIYPGVTDYSVSAAIVQDVSYSMSNEAIQQSRSETEAILRELQCSVKYYVADTEVKAVSNITSVKEQKLNLGGGTDMTVPIAVAMKAKPPPDLVILFTDGFTPWPKRHDMKNAVLLAVLCGEWVQERKNIPHWIKVVKVGKAGQ